jgi:hypothetical protein
MLFKRFPRIDRQSCVSGFLDVGRIDRECLDTVAGLLEIISRDISDLARSEDDDWWLRRRLYQSDFSFAESRRTLAADRRTLNGRYGSPPLTVGLVR